MDTREAPLGRRQAWPAEAREAALAAYAATGSVEAAAGMVRIPATTVRGWVRAPEARPIVERAQREHARDAALSAAAVWREAVERCRTRLALGDEVIGKDGQIQHRAVSARESAVVAGIMAEKAELWARMAADAAAIAPAQLSAESLTAAQQAAELVNLELRRRQIQSQVIIEVGEQQSSQGKCDSDIDIDQAASLKAPIDTPILNPSIDPKTIIDPLDPSIIDPSSSTSNAPSPLCSGENRSFDPRGNKGLKRDRKLRSDAGTRRVSSSLVTGG